MDGIKQESALLGQQLYARQVALLYQNGPLVCGLLLTGGAIVTGVAWERLLTPGVSFWLGCLLVTVLGAAAMFLRYCNAEPEVGEVSSWARGYLVGAGLAGLLLGAGALILFSADSLLRQAFAALAMAGLIAAAVSLLAALLPVALAFIGLTMFPIVARLWIAADAGEAGQSLLIMIVLGLLFTGLMVFLALRMRRLIERSLRLQLERQALLERAETGRLAQRKAARLSALYSFQSQIAKAVVRIRDREALFREVCRIATHWGGFKLAWIGLPEEHSRRLRPVAVSGPAEDFIQRSAISTDPNQPEGLGVAGKAFRKGDSHVVNDFLNDPDTRCFHAEAAAAGIRSAAAFALYEEEETVAGVFVVYAGEPDYFDQELIDLLYENAMQLSHALDNLLHEACRRQTEKQLTLWSKVFESSGEAIFITNAGREILTVNRAYTETTGYEPADVVGREPQLLHQDKQNEAFYQGLWAYVVETGHWQGELLERRKNGEHYPVWLAISLIRNAQGQATNYIGILSDLSERKAAEERIYYLAYHDVLTGLPNRVLLEDRLEQAFAQAKRHGWKVALLYLDLDRFKNINDSLGHGVGDRLLQLVAERLLACVRESDTVCRQGGDEFVIVVNEVKGAETAEQVAKKLLAAVAEPYMIEGHELHVTPSIGIGLYPDDAVEPGGLIKHADTAMYCAKERGRNAYQFFTLDMNARVSERLRLETGLRRALERQELRLHYQPQIDVNNSIIVGVEALLRWQHPELGLVSPAEFIPVAEESGLIVPIGEWVLREVCWQIRRWQESGLSPFPVAVNLSPVQFARPGLLEAVALALEETGIDPRYLELELTERVVMQDIDSTLKIMHALKDMGIRISIDDFGTGYCSLGYLKRFPVDKLKVDQSFVRDVTTNSDDAEITRAIIGMARSLRLKVTAEGVETEEQLDFLRSQQCDEMQGFYACRPLPAEELARFIAERAM